MMDTQAPPTPDLFFDSIFAFQRSAALKAAIDVDLFTAIGSGAKTPKDLAAACGIPERSARILADYMTIVGFVVKADGTYALTADTAAFLTKTSPMYLGGTVEFLYSDEVLERVKTLSDTVRRGKPVLNMVAGEDPAWVHFARAMVPMMMPSAHAIADLLDASAGRPMRVLDIAAGHGMFGIVIAQRNAKAEIVAADWPSVLAVAAQHASAMGVAARHHQLPGDAFKVDFGTGFDVALVTNFLHHFDRPTCVGFLRKTAAALNAGGRVAVLEFVPNDDRVTPPMAARFSLTMLSNTDGGDAYTFRELSGMLTEAGFSRITQHPLQGPETVLLATK
jgi:SAM-dependent methyltransferase